MEKSTPSSLLDNPYYFCESGSEASWKQVADAIGEGLHKAGKIQDPTPKTLPEDLYGDVFADCTCHNLVDLAGSAISSKVRSFETFADEQ